jgi:hypothetical protein
MKHVSQNIREIVAEIRAALPGFPAAKQTELDAFALRIAAELDILDGAKRDAPEPKPAKTPKAPAAE